MCSGISFAFLYVVPNKIEYFFKIEKAILVEFIDLAAYLNKQINLCGFREECKFGVVCFYYSAHLLDTLDLINQVTRSEYASDAKAYVFELNWIVLVNSPVVEHLN